MRITVVVIFSLFFLSNLSAQVVFNTSHHNLGEINKNNKKYYDFTLTNAGKETATIVRLEEPYGVDVKFSKEEILPDSTIIVRIKYTPKKKGKFKKNIPIWISVNNEPITLTLEGEAKSFDINELLQCPDFKSIQQAKELKSELKIKVIDVHTKKPIKDAVVQIIWDGLNYKKLKTDKKGIITQNLKWDNYYFVVNAENYGTKEIDFKVDQENDYLEFELGEPTEEEIVAVKEDTLIEEVVVIEPEDTVSTKDLPVNLFAPNNVVFCIDVSVSMKQEGRLDLLKASMIELLNGLRPIDKLAIVTYSSTVTTVLKSEYVTDKVTITELIKELTAGGYTAGGKGIKKAYQLARANKIEEGNNQVIVATDGGFILKGNDILENIALNYKKGVVISVLGVKNKKTTVRSMSSIAKTGHGNYIHIESYYQAKKVLMDEIKNNSRKK
ncbi:MAG: VWA domain-containing protein [Flavobacteriales bacterium]